MRSHAMSRGRLLAVCVLGALASVVPSASADTTLPVWTCRASAAYVEVPGVLGETRVEPILANGFPRRDPNADTSQCVTTQTGVQNVNLLPGTGLGAPLVRLNGAFATTQITPELAAARDQQVFANGGVTNPLEITLGGIVITADLVNAEARASCVGATPATRTPQLTSTSEIINLRINGAPIAIPQDASPILLDLLLVRVTFNQIVSAGTAASADQSLTRRAAVVELLPTLAPGAAPLATVVLGEAKVDRHGAVCAPLAPPPPCPAGFIAQDPNANPLVCLRTVTGPCPANSTPDPAAGGACVIIREVNAPCPAGSVADPARGNACILVVQSPPANCPSSTTRDPATKNCVLIRDRPCPKGSTPDPATRVCVVVIARTTGSGENGRIGSSNGPVATCGRLEMHFVRGRRNVGRSFTSRFGNRTVTRGRLVTCGANPRPIVGARVDVVHVLPGDKRRRKTGLRSRANGRLTLILPIDLRSRGIDYAYRPDLRSTRVTSRVTLRLTVRSSRGRILR